MLTSYLEHDNEPDIFTAQVSLALLLQQTQDSRNKMSRSRFQSSEVKNYSWKVTARSTKSAHEGLQEQIFQVLRQKLRTFVT